MIDLPFQADRTNPPPVYRQLEAYLRGLIESGRLPTGRKLPATRELARTLGLGRVTVNRAYETLRREGLL
ncbi:MAG: GntR family transcriptional regulator, partial [Candidatus Binatia bacterium]